jgi:NTP pyrophosphatase (non-canonical NTP hydrolase)
VIPTRIDGCTRVLGAPVGWTPETSGQCVGLPIRDEMNGDVPCMVSSWEPTPEELRAIAAGGKVYLRVLGAGHPPVMVFAADVFWPAPAAPHALERAIAELDAFERDGTILSEVENEVSFIESVALCLHELKRLRAAPREDFLTQLRRVNGERYAAWTGDGVEDPLYLSNEFGGEAGDIQNVVKKLVREQRGWRGSRATVEQLADEIADGIICLDNLARGYGIDLAEAVARKFNETSEKNGFPHKLSRSGPAVVQP